MGSWRFAAAGHRTTGRLITVLTCLIGSFASLASAQPTITTYVGTAEIVAVARDSSGNVYFATDRPGAIFKKNGVTGTVTRVAGKAGGSTADDEVAADAAVFPGRNGLAIDETDSIFFSEPSTHHVRRIDAESGRVSTIAGSWSGFHHDPRQIEGGPAASTEFAAPGALAFNPLTGDLFVADEIWDIVYRISTNGAGPIDAFFNASAYLFAGGNPANPSIFVNSFWYNPFGNTGDSGPALDAKLNHPRGLAFDTGGNLYIADTGNNVIRRVNAAGTISRFAGTAAAGFAGDGGPAAAAQLFMPSGVAVDAVGNLLIADTANHRVRLVAAGTTTITTLAGNGVAGHGGDGSAAIGASLAYPLGIAIDAAGNRLIADSQNNRLRRVALDGSISTLVSNGADYAGDGLPGGNAVNQPWYVAIDQAGNLFFSDSGNARVRRVDGQSRAITTVAGNGIPGNQGDGGAATAARLNCPAGLVFSSTGRLFIADPCANVVRVVDAGADGLVKGTADETITTYAGTGVRGRAEDGEGGAATQAALNAPLSLAMDAAGTLFIGEDDVASIRAVDQVTGQITTPLTDVGSRGMGVDGAGHYLIADDFNGGFYCNLRGLSTGDVSSLSEEFYAGLAFGGLGRFFVSQDHGFHSVLQFAPVSGSLCSGQFVASTLVGGDSVGYSGDGGLAAAATLNHPAGLAGAQNGALFIADSGNNVIRQVVQPVVSVVLDASALAFGMQPVNASSQAMRVTVTSTGSDSASISASTLTGLNAGEFTIVSDTCAGAVLGTTQTCQVGVTFTPTQTGARSAILHINDNAPGSPQIVTLSGTGVVPATIATAVAAPTQTAFGAVAVGSSSSAVTVTLTSTGTAPLSVNAVTLGGNQPGDFVLSGDTCTGASVPPGQHCTVAIAFAPLQVCGATAVLSFADNAADSPQLVNLSGVGIAAATGRFTSTLYCTTFAAEPQELAAGADGRVWFDELGSRFAVPAIAAVSSTAGVQEQPGAVQPAWQPYELTFAPDGSYAYIEARGAGFPIWLDVVSAAGVKTQYPIAGNAGPLGVGPDGAFWYAAEHTCPGSSGVPLITRYAPGKAPVDYTPTLPWLQANTNNHVCAAASLVTAGPDGTVWIGLSDTIGGISSSPLGFLRVSTKGVFIDFTPTAGFPTAATIGADGNLYTLISTTNSCSLQRFDPLGAITSVPLGPSSFASCRSIAAGPDGRLWMIGSVFNGTGFITSMIGVDPVTGSVDSYPAPASQFLTAGPDEGIWFNSLPSAVGRFDIGGSAARAFASPKIIGFSPTARGVPSPSQAVTIRSSGTGPLTISNISLGGADATQFVVSDTCNGAVLPPGNSCTVLVASRPTETGSHAATLIIQDDDAFSPQIVRLQEFTLPPPPIASPASIAFPTTLVGQHSAASTITLTNPASKPLHVASVSVSGTHSADFVVVTDLCSGTSVAGGGGSCTATIRFAPTAAGNRTATVAFTDNANPSIQSVTLKGGGQNSQGGSTTTPCACSTTGLFVDPVVVAPKAAATSPHGLFKLIVAPGGPNGGPALLTVTNPSGTATVMTFAPPADATWPTKSPWGFSPDDKRFAVHFQSIGEDWIELFDLTGTQPSTPVRALHIPIAPGSTVTSPSGSLGFSPHGDYLVTAQLQTPASSPYQTVVLNLVSSTGTVLQTTTWNPVRTPASPHTKVDSAFWGFSPDDQSFTFIMLDANGIPTLTLVSLPSGIVVHHETFTNSLATYVQFAPCSEVLGLVNQLTDPLQSAPANAVSISLFSTKATDANAAAIAIVSSLPVATMQLAAGPVNYTASFAGLPNPVTLGPNHAAAACAAPTASGSGGGLPAPEPPAAPLFIEKSPPMSAVVGQTYQYTFEAIGEPDPTYALKAFAPSWLTIDEDSGTVTGKPPVGTTSFTFSVVASNAVGFDDVGPFVVAVSSPSAPPAAKSANTLRLQSSAFDTTSDGTAAAEGSTSGLAGPQTILLLPNGRGEIHLPADVTPAVSVFNYVETDAPTGPLGNLIFAGLDFTFVAIDATSGAPVSTFVDPPRAAIVFRDEEMRAARIQDVASLALYWWSGTAWINQLPCPGCGANADSHTLIVALTHPGEYLLAAVPRPVALTITPASLQATAGVTFAGTIADFPPAAAADSLNQYAAILTWGDGQVSQGQLSASDAGLFIVSGTHIWSASGSFPVGITILDNGVLQTVHATATVTAVQSAPTFTAATPPLTATQGVPYTYAFGASGVPKPTFALASNAPTWLSIAPATGVLSGTPPAGTTSFTYGVVASNGISPSASAGPFVVAVSAIVNRSADVSISLNGPATAVKGSTVTYTAVVVNQGPSPARNAVVLLGVEPGGSFVGATPSPLHILPGLWSWSIATLASGQSVTITLRVKVTAKGTVVAASAVGSETHDAQLDNNLSAVRTTVK